MTASFPAALKTYTTKVDGVDYPTAAHVNSYQEEIVAIETALGVAMANITHPVFQKASNTGNTGTGEDDLYSVTLAANQLSVNGQSINAQYGGYFVGHATATRQVKIYFGGTVIMDTTALAITATTEWKARVILIRISSTSTRCIAEFYRFTTLTHATITDVTATLANTQILKVTGESAGTGGGTNNDVVLQLGHGVWYPVPY